MAKKRENNQALVPELRFPEFRGNREWDRFSLGELAKIVRGGSPRPIDGFLTKDISGLNWLKIGDVDKDAQFVTWTKERVRPEALSKTREVFPGDLILSNSMSFGRPYILKIQTCIHDGWIAVSNIKMTVTNIFLYYSIMSPGSQRFFLDQAAGSGVRNLNADIIKSLPAFLPRPPEQQKIADCLGSLDNLIAAHSAKLGALQDHKKGLLQQLFPVKGETAPARRFPEFAGDGEWEKGKAGNVFKNRSERGVAGLEIYSVTMNEGLVKRSSLARKFGDIAKPSGNKRVHRGDIVYNMMRMWQGASGVAPEDCLVSPAYIVLAPQKNVCSDFFSYLLKLQRTTQILAAYSRGLTEDRLRLYYDEFATISLRFPKPPEQQKIADSLSSLDTLIAVQTQQIDVLKEHKQALMQQLFPNPELSKA